MMKTKIMTLLTVIIALCSCSSTKAKQQEMNKSEDSKALVVYYSWGGNAREAATMIREMTNADIFELQPSVPYTTNREEIEEVAKKEVHEQYCPELKSLPDSIDTYNRIFIVSPCWFNTFAPPVRTFLTKVNLDGKTLIPVMSNEGSGMSQYISDIKVLAPNAVVTDGLSIYGPNTKEERGSIEGWLRNNGLTK